MCVIYKCTDTPVLSNTGTINTDIGAIWHIMMFLMIYKLLNTLIMNFLTCWQSLVNQTHHYQKREFKKTL